MKELIRNAAKAIIQITGKTSSMLTLTFVGNAFWEIAGVPKDNKNKQRLILFTLFFKFKRKVFIAVDLGCLTILNNYTAYEI